VVADAVYIVKVEDLTDAVTWAPDLPASGTYQVYAKWTADETRATDARYSIVHEGGTAEVGVNQRAAGGLWQYLGSYTFDPLNTPTVSLAANDNGSVAADAVRFVGGPGGAIDIAYLHADHLGTPQAMTDANALVLWWRDQTPFGQTVAEGGFSSTPIRFPGQVADAESSLAYNYFRDYDPALGRYIQSDPIGLMGGLNTFGYVGGNPLNRTDPEGLTWGAVVGPKPLIQARPVPPGQLIDPLPPMVLPRDGAEPSDRDDATDRLEERKKYEYYRYHKICDERPPPRMDRCEEAMWRLNKLQRCKSSRLDWDKSWGPGRGHSDQIERVERAIQNAIRDTQRYCLTACAPQ
jgi:RHS repeat-associated protein